MENTRSKSCYTCLSEDRNTWPLKEYSHIYIKLFDKSDSTMLNERHICWECRAIFRKIQQFINKATYAQSILSQEDQADGAAPSNNESAEDLIELDNQNGHPDIIALTELDRIKSLPLLSDKPRDVCDFADQFENSVAALRALKRPNYLHNFLLVRYLTEKLPPVLRVPWYEHYYDKPQDEPDLLTFNNYIVGLARRCRPFVTPEIVEQKRTRRAKACAVCEQDRHAPAECPKMKGASFDDRWVIAKEQRLCFRCLRVRASFHKCGFKKCQVDGCERSHHPLLHERPVEPEDAELEVAESEEVDSEVAESEKVDPGAAESVVVDPEVAESGVMDPDSYSYVRILPVRLSGPKDHLDTFAVLADGSVATLLDADVAAQIGADGPLDPIGLVDFTGTQIETARLVSVHIQGQGPAARHEVQARTTKNLRLLPQTVCDRNLRHYKHLDDIRQYLTYESGRPTLLIGQDNCSLLVVEEVRRGPVTQPVACRTALGWALFGTHNYSGVHRVYTLFHKTSDRMLSSN